MNKKHSLFTITFITYLAAGAIAIFLFASDGSRLSRSQNAMADAATETNDDTILPIAPFAPPTESAEALTEEAEPVEPEAPMAVEEPVITEEPADAEELPAPEATVEPVEPIEPEETDTAALEDSVSETTDAPETDETASTDESDDSNEDDTIYYGFTVMSGVNNIRIRETENRNSKIVSHIDGGESGYVLEQGTNRTKILTQKGTVGYIFNEYITISEIPKDDFPEEYR